MLVQSAMGLKDSSGCDRILGKWQPDLIIGSIQGAISGGVALVMLQLSFYHALKSSPGFLRGSDNFQLEEQGVLLGIIFNLPFVLLNYDRYLDSYTWEPHK